MQIPDVIKVVHRLIQMGGPLTKRLSLSIDDITSAILLVIFTYICIYVYGTNVSNDAISRAACTVLHPGLTTFHHLDLGLQTFVNDLPTRQVFKGQINLNFGYTPRPHPHPIAASQDKPQIYLTSWMPSFHSDSHFPEIGKVKLVRELHSRGTDYAYMQKKDTGKCCPRNYSVFKNRKSFCFSSYTNKKIYCAAICFIQQLYGDCE